MKILSLSLIALLATLVFGCVATDPTHSEALSTKTAKGSESEDETRSISVVPKDSESEDEAQSFKLQSVDDSSSDNFPEATTDGQKRYALIIGNSKYDGQHWSQLSNPVNDAREMKKALESLPKGKKFQVTYLEDATYSQMEEATNDFAEKLRGGGVGLFYYAGHGSQIADNRVAGKNYLIPVDLNSNKEIDVKHKSLSADYVLDTMKDARNDFNIIILDACRTNGLARGRTRGTGGNGLAAMTESQGSFIAFSTSANNTAADGSGKNSPYAKYLVEAIKSENMTLEQMFKQVRTKVRKETNGEQRPVEYTQLEGADFCFVSCPGEKNFAEVERFKQEAERARQEAEQERQARIEAEKRQQQSPILAEVERLKQEAERARQEAEQEHQVRIEAEKRQQQSPILTVEAPENIPVSKPEESVFQDKLKDGSLAPKMVVIPKGSFEMGSHDGGSDEKPVHTVTIDDEFAMGQYEVTFEEYDKFCEATGREKPGDEGWGRGNRPVIRVDWNDAKAYAQWLSEQTGHTYRLPTEAEWEYAARAGTETDYWWGNDIGHNNANCNGCGSQWDNKQTAPVGSFKPNPFGLHDMHGNVWEWTCSAYTDSYNGSEITCDMTNEELRVLRGGSWFNDPGRVRSADRTWDNLAYRFDNVGFRLIIPSL